jgi:hypothetical protein
MLNATIIGHDFTGKAHAHAWRNDPPSSTSLPNRYSRCAGTA